MSIGIKSAKSSLGQIYRKNGLICSKINYNEKDREENLQIQ